MKVWNKIAERGAVVPKHLAQSLEKDGGSLDVMFAGTQVFDITNVVSTFEHDGEVTGPTTGKTPREAFPNVRPPFPRMFFEAGQPWLPAVFLEEVVNPAGQRILFLRTVGPWSEDAATFAIDFCPLAIEIDDAGGIMSVLAIPDDEDRAACEEDGHARRVWLYATYTLHAICILNCVGVRTTTVEPPAALQKKRQKRGKPPLVSYKVLEIDTFKPRRERNEIGGEQSPAALHHVRGHYADYREGNGLFGRYRGLYWRGPTIRGSAEHGVVTKTYALK